MNENRAAVVGMGTMGTGIAEVLLTGGFTVTCIDVVQEIAESSIENVNKRVRKSFERGRIGEDPSVLMKRITTSADYRSINDVAFVIEAVAEDYEEKKRVIRAVELAVDVSTIIATNTSSLSITQLSLALETPSRFAGMHFFNPAQRMPLVEIVGGARTSPATLDSCVELAMNLGKTPVVVKDSPGFVVNRLLIPYLIEAGRLLDRGVASPAEIDTCMKLGAGHPMGPFELSDMIGIDIIMEIARRLGSSGVKDDEIDIPDSFKRLADTGRLGRKTGGGFFEY